MARNVPFEEWFYFLEQYQIEMVAIVAILLDQVCFVLDQHAELDFYSASSLEQRSAGRHVAPLGHIVLIPSQPVFALSP
jgi:hypothetical protein